MNMNITFPACPITEDTRAKVVFRYNAPPPGEVGFKYDDKTPYYREILQYFPSNHFINKHQMNIDHSYNGAYVDATYKNSENMLKTFDKIIKLPPEFSDNAGRLKAIVEFAREFFSVDYNPRVLDIGSGLGVFPHAVKTHGWDCVAIDPDPQSASHIRDNVGVEVVCGDFNQIEPEKKFEIVTLNKVLEHVLNPIELLAKVRRWMSPHGFVYLEVPDGEIASQYGPGREEFFVEHHHVFSMASVSIMSSKANFNIRSISRLREPSGKYTIRAFLI